MTSIEIMMRKDNVFVFGSNLAGIHGAGAAKSARLYHAAAIGVGEGRSGYSYGIPTKDHNLEVRALDDIRASVNSFIEYAEANPRIAFNVTRIGCGYAGFLDEQIAPMFNDCPANCGFDEMWRYYLGDERHYWGTF
jgi:hypothetical protein